MIKIMEKLLPGEIILHPIFREDGLMLVNRYSTISQNTLKQIHIHLRGELPVIIVLVEEELNRFIRNEVYSNENFIYLLEEVIFNSIGNYKTPIELESYLDSRVNLKDFIKNKEKDFISEGASTYSLLGKLISSTPLWSSFELQLESEVLQNRANDILKIFFYRSNIFKIGQPFIDPKNHKGVIIGFRNFIEDPVKPIVKFSNDKITDFYDYVW
jgi:hypothetical protein